MTASLPVRSPFPHGFLANERRQMCSRWTAAHRSAEHPYWIRWMSMTGQRAGGTIEQNRSRSRQSKERGEVDMSIDDHTVLRTTPRSVCCFVLLFVNIVLLHSTLRAECVTLQCPNVKHEAGRAGGWTWCVESVVAGPRHGPRGGSRAGARARAARPRGDSGHSRIRDVLGQEQGQAAQSSACCARPRWPRVRSPTRGGTPAEFPRRRTRACLAFGLFAFRVGFPFPGVSYSLHVLFCIVHHCLGVWRFRLVPLDGT